MALRAVLIGVLATAGETYAQRITSLNPISYYKLNEAAGTALGDTQGQVNGTVSGSIEYGVPSIADKDPGGQCLGFDGSTTRGVIPFDAAHKPAAGGVAVLAQPDHVDVKQIVVASDTTNADGGWSLEILAGGQPRAFLWDGTTLVELLGAAGSIVAGEAHHLALTWGPGGLTLYVDGVAADSDAATAGADQNTTSETTIGGWHTGADRFDGLLGHLVVFSTQPSAQDVASIALPQGVSLANSIDAGSVVENQTETIDVRSPGHFKGTIAPSIVSQGSLGTASPNGEDIDYAAGGTPGNDDTFTYAVTDDRGAGNTATITIDVIEQPVASDDATPWGFLNPQDAPYNAVGDGVADDTTALQSWADDLGNSGAGWMQPDKTYRITNTLVFPTENANGIDARHVRAWAKQITYDGANDRDAIRLGEPGDRHRSSDFDFCPIVNANQSDWSNTGCVGIHLQDDISAVRYRFTRVQGFTSGIKITGDGAQIAAYGPIRVGMLKNNHRGIWLFGTGGNSSFWFNENHFLGPHFSVDDGFSDTTSARYGFYYSDALANGNDGNNTWLGTLFDMHPEDTSGETALFYNFGNDSCWNFAIALGFSSYGTYDLLLRTVADIGSPDSGTGWANSFWGVYCDNDFTTSNIQEVNLDNRNPFGDVVQVLDYTEGGTNISGAGGFLF